MNSNTTVELGMARSEANDFVSEKGNAAEEARAVSFIPATDAVQLLVASAPAPRRPNRSVPLHYGESEQERRQRIAEKSPTDDELRNASSVPLADWHKEVW